MRLALHVAEDELETYSDGIWPVELAPPGRPVGTGDGRILWEGWGARVADVIEHTGQTSIDQLSHPRRADVVLSGEVQDRLRRDLSQAVVAKQDFPFHRREGVESRLRQPTQRVGIRAGAVQRVLARLFGELWGARLLPMVFDAPCASGRIACQTRRLSALELVSAGWAARRLNSIA
jgi:hypothetical protein